MKPLKEVTSLSQLFKHLKNSFYRAYLPDGVDPVNKTMNGSRTAYKNPLFNKSATHIYRKSMLTALISFLGLPNRKLDNIKGTNRKIELDKEISVRFMLMNVIKNFFGWQPEKKFPRLLLNFLLVTPLNLIATPLKLAVNIVKLATEFLPAFLHKLSYYAGENLIDMGTQLFGFKGYFRIPGIILAIPVSLLGYGLKYSQLFFYLIYELGRSLTSPFDSLRDTWKTTEDYGRAIQVIATAAHAFVVLSVFTFGLPVLAKLLAALLLPALPSSVIAIVTKIANLPFFAAISKVSLPVANIFTYNLAKMTGLYKIAASMPAVAGLGTVIGLGMTTVGSGVNKLVTNARKWWHKEEDLENVSTYGRLTTNTLTSRPAFTSSYQVTSLQPVTNYPSPVGTGQITSLEPRPAPQAPSTPSIPFISGSFV